MRQSALVLTTALIALGASGTPAQALSQRGHQFAGAFGEAGEVGHTPKPTAIAVNEATGDVYVLESANNEVVVYGPDHKFLEAWGAGVKDGAKTFETCTTACKAGVESPGSTKEPGFQQPVAIAVDNSGGPSEGDVYVVANRNWKKSAVDKFSAKGAFLGNLITKAEKEEELEQVIQGLAVDQHGTVWVEREEEEEEFSLTQYANGRLTGRSSEVEEFEVLQEAGTTAFADWLNVSELDNEELAVYESHGGGEGAEIGSLSRPVKPGFALDSAGGFYLTYSPFAHDFEELHEHEHFERKETMEEPCVVHKCFAEKFGLSEGEALTSIAKLDRENTTGIAVDTEAGEASNEVFADNGSSVAAFSPTGELVQRFGKAQLADGGGSGVAVDSATGEVLVAELAAGGVEVYKPEPAGAPVVEPGSVYFSHGQATSAELHATISPNGGSEPTAMFEFGTEPCSTGTCAHVVASPALTEGFSDQLVTAQLTGLAPSTTYHFRVTAENALGTVTSEERTLTTQPSAVEASLLDGRAWELVSDGNKHGGAIEPLRLEGGLIQAAENGRAIAYVADSVVGEGEVHGFSGPEPTEIFGKRTGTSWSTEDISVENGAPSPGLKLGGPWAYEAFSSNLDTSLLIPFSSVPPAQYESLKGTALGIFERAMETCPTEPESCYTPLAQGTTFTKAPLYEGGSADLHHVLFLSSTPLTPNAPPAPALSLYEWSREAAPGKQLQLVSLMPGGTPATGALRAGALIESHSRLHAISEDGSRVFWTHEEGSATALHLYMTITGASPTTTLVDEPNTNAPRVNGKLVGVQVPSYQGASTDGSVAFFTDGQRLAEGSQVVSDHEPDLYAFEPSKPAGSRLTDLTPDLVKGEAASVQGEADISNDGSYVYFVANGVLAPGAEPGDCRAERPRSAGCNLYVVHRGASGWEKPRFIQRLSDEDVADWGPVHEEGPSDAHQKEVSSRVSPNGEWFAFMSDRELTGYNNHDANSGQADEEVFLYHYTSGNTVCASCNPSGQPPVGVEDVPNAGEGQGLLVDRTGAWQSLEGALPGEIEFAGTDSWLAGSLPTWSSFGNESHTAFHQPRYLSDKGRLFFDSADALVPLAKPTRVETINGEPQNVGVENVYEYEPHGLGSCGADNTEEGCVQLISSGESAAESAFVDASETGEDVFFVTAQKLTPGDGDSTYDLYDARICKEAGSEPCPTAPPEETPPCTGEGEHNCRGASSGPVTFSAPATGAPSGSGNVTGQTQVLTEKQAVKPATKAPAKLTNAQKLAAALKKCHKLKQKKKRVSCEKQARKKYPVKKSAKKAKR